MASHVTIRIPTPLRSFTQGNGEVRVAATTVREALEQLGAEHGEILSRILDERGELRSFVNVFVGDRNVRALEGLASAVPTGGTISIIPAVAGGAPGGKP